MKHIQNILSTCLILMACLTACKDKDTELDNEVVSSYDSYLVEANVNDVIKEADEAVLNNGFGKTGPTITIDSTVNPKVMTINYGLGTIGKDGKTRKGKIKVTWSGKYKNAGTIITITPDSFYINGNQLEGVKKIENLGRNTDGFLSYKIDVTQAKLTKIDGTVSTWNASRNRTWIEGENTIDINDDVYVITGNASGTAANGRTYSAIITKPLRADFSCIYKFTEGTFELKPTGKFTRIIDYGNGTCDNSFTVTINNRKITVNR